MAKWKRGNVRTAELPGVFFTMPGYISDACPGLAINQTTVGTSHHPIGWSVTHLHTGWAVKSCIATLAMAKRFAELLTEHTEGKAWARKLGPRGIKKDATLRAGFQAVNEACDWYRKGSCP